MNNRMKLSDPIEPTGAPSNEEHPVESPSSEDQKPGLFRKEVVDHQRSQVWGSVLIPTPWSMSLLASLSLVFATAFILFISTAEYTRKHTVSGFVAPQGGVVKVFPEQKGQFTKIHVSEQQKVKRGDPLVTVVQQMADGQESDVYQNRLQEVDYQIEALRENIGYAKRNSELEAQQLERLLDQTRSEIQLLKSQLDTQLSRVSIAKSKYERIRQLGEKKMIAKVQVESAFDEYLVQTDLAQQVEQQLLNRDNSLAQQMAQKQREEIQALELNNQLGSQLSYLRERRIQIEADRSFILRAPTDGVVTGIQATIGATVTPGIPLLSIVPTEKHYQAFLYLPTVVMGSVNEGQSVRIKFDAFPYQKFGFYDGTINEISQTIYTPNELDIPIQVNRSVYRVIASINQSSVVPLEGKEANERVDGEAENQMNSPLGTTARKTHREISLQPGMTLTADILYDKRTLLEWIFKPIYGLRQ